jgi:hypothetical protein
MEEFVRSDLEMRHRIMDADTTWACGFRNGAAPQTFLRRSYRNRIVEDAAMENHDSKSSRLGAQWRRYEESETTVAAIFGGIAALFIAGIAAAFLYAKDTNPIQSASTPASPVTSSVQAPATSPAPETTGSGAADTSQPKQQPGEAGQKKRP